MANEESRGPERALPPKALPKALANPDLAFAPPLRANGEAPPKPPPKVSVGAIEGTVDVVALAPPKLPKVPDVVVLAPPKLPKDPDEAEPPPNTLGFEPAMAKPDCVVASLAKPELANADGDVTAGLSPLVPLATSDVFFAAQVLSWLDRDESPESCAARVSPTICVTLYVWDATDLSVLRPTSSRFGVAVALLLGLRRFRSGLSDGSYGRLAGSLT